MTFRVNSAAKASDDSRLLIGKWADDAPPKKLVFLGH
jgi:hypothetical protein